MNAEPPSRPVRFVQAMISRLAPPLHSLHWKIFALTMAAIFLPAVYFLWEVRVTIERSHLRSTENGMIDAALLVAESLASKPDWSSLDVVATLRETVFADRTPDLRVVVYDPAGHVVSDSAQMLRIGTDLSAERDVHQALMKKYGSRWEYDSYRRAVVLYSTIPIKDPSQRFGAVSVIKTTADVRVSILRSLKDLAVPVALAFLLAAGASYALSSYLTGVISDLARRAEQIAAGEQGVRLETWSQSELGGLARAFERMREKLEGKRYVEEMAATLSHELKTPLTSIRGAAEILESDPAPPVRARFLANIRSDVDRMGAIIENLLALARAETLPVDPAPRCNAAPVFHDLVAAARRRAEAAGVVIASTCTAAPTFRIPAEHFRRIGDVLAENAIAFTPPGGQVTFTLDAKGVTITDSGPGIPEAVRTKVFDRFFTTVNPLTGRRGTGLGLALAASLARRYGARISLTPGTPCGTIARVDFMVLS